MKAEAWKSSNNTAAQLCSKYPTTTSTKTILQSYVKKPWWMKEGRKADIPNNYIQMIQSCIICMISLREEFSKITESVCYEPHDGV